MMLKNYNYSSHKSEEFMDINFVEIEHRQKVLELMEICGIEMQQAYQLYTSTGYNFEAAINRKFNPPPQQPQIPPEQVYDPHPAQQDLGANMYDPNGFYEDDDDLEYTHFKEFKKSGKSFDKKYPARPHQSIIQSFIPKFFKGNQESAFKKELEEYLGRRSNIKCDPGNLSESLNWCWKQKFPMAAILLDFSANLTPVIRRFFAEELLIDKVISQQFKAYGLNTKTYDLEPELKPFFNLERDANSIVICRVNHVDEVNIVSRISLNEHIDDIKKKIKQAKSACIQNELDESHIARQFTEELRGNFNYQRPKTIKESIKQREDKKLRKQQEDEFFKACQPKGPKGKEEERPQKQKIVPSEIRNSQKQPQIKPPRQECIQQIRPPVREVKPEIKPPPQQVPVISQEKVKAARADKQSRLRKYSDGITFKIRLPSGSNIMVTVGKEEFIQYLFEYVECQPDDLGFADELNRKFDISIGFGGSQTLKGKERKKIKDIFEDSEVLIVREL